MRLWNNIYWSINNKVKTPSKNLPRKWKYKHFNFGKNLWSAWVWYKWYNGNWKRRRSGRCRMLPANLVPTDITAQLNGRIALRVKDTQSNDSWENRRAMLFYICWRTWRSSRGSNIRKQLMGYTTGKEFQNWNRSGLRILNHSPILKKLI